MLFNSFLFWVIFPFIFSLYWLIPARWKQCRKVYLILVSYLLYMNWNPASALLLVGVTLVTWWGGLKLADKERRKKALMVMVLLIALLPLVIFKYYNFICTSVTDALSAVGLHFELTGLNWAVPMGISFFTFQAVGYVCDVWFGKTQAVRSLLDYGLFISFFPQITCGPISKAGELIPQIQSERKFDYNQGVQGLKLILWGIFMKVVVADRLGIFVDTTYADWDKFSGSVCLVASIFYTIQIYGDFAGYSLLAIGISKLLGFDLVNNFARPYFSTSITDFWRRWHISLSRWLRDYIYIPLGGSRCSKSRTYFNIFVTFLVSGIWHGANWTFIVWGVLHGVFQIIEKALGIAKKQVMGLRRVVHIIVTFFLVNLAWIFFRMPTLSDACGIIGHVFAMSEGIGGKNTRTDLPCYIVGIGLLLFKDLRDEFFADKMTILDTRWCRWAIYVFLMLLVLSIGVLDSGSFIYVSF